MVRLFDSSKKGVHDCRYVYRDAVRIFSGIDHFYSMRLVGREVQESVPYAIVKLSRFTIEPVLFRGVPPSGEALFHRQVEEEGQVIKHV